MPEELDPSAAAKALSKLGASKGGRARAEALAPETRARIARRAAKARWGLPQATHDGKLTIGDITFDCAVLESGERVLSERSFMDSMGMYFSGYISKKRKETPQEGGAETDAVLPLYVAYEKLKPFIDKELRELLLAPLKYRTTSGQVAHGIRAELIPKVCNVWLKARDAGGLGKRQASIAKKADVLVRALSEVGIVALVDEATGFQRDREKDALAKILEAFIAKELAEWVKTFEDDYYLQIYRLKGWGAPEGTARTPLIGKITKDIVYSRLAPGVLKELERISPRDAKGRLLHHWHRRLTRHHGYQKLKAHMDVVVALLKLAPDWPTFARNLEQVKPRFNLTGVLPFEEDK